MFIWHLGIRRLLRHLKKSKVRNQLYTLSCPIAYLFNKPVESSPNVDDKEVNKKLVERSKNIKVVGKDVSASSPREMGDKRPSKEKEMARWAGLSSEATKIDIDYQKYGYSRPDKIRPGQLTLRQFDEMINEYRAKNASMDVIDRCAQEFKIDKNELIILIEYYKPLYRVDKSEPVQEAIGVDKIFPNIKLVK